MSVARDREVAPEAQALGARPAGDELELFRERLANLVVGINAMRLSACHAGFMAVEFLRQVLIEWVDSVGDCALVLSVYTAWEQGSADLPDQAPGRDELIGLMHQRIQRSAWWLESVGVMHGCGHAH